MFPIGNELLAFILMEKVNMAFVQRANNGSLFKNSNKEKDTHPDYTGEANVNGVLYFMDAWIKEGTGGKWMSFSFKKKQKQEGADQPNYDVPM